MDTTLTSITQDFAQQLLEHVEEFKELQFARADLNENQESSDLFNKITDTKETIALLKSKDLPVSEEQEAELSLLLSRMRDDEIIMKYIRTKNAARKKALLVGNLLESLMGTDFATGRSCC